MSQMRPIYNSGFLMSGGVIGGRTHSYMSVGWGLAFVGTGANVFYNLADLGRQVNTAIIFRIEHGILLVQRKTIQAISLLQTKKSLQEE